MGFPTGFISPCPKWGQPHQYQINALFSTSGITAISWDVTKVFHSCCQAQIKDGEGKEVTLSYQTTKPVILSVMFKLDITKDADSYNLRVN